MNFTGTVMVVDDEAHIRKFVTLLLKSLGITAVVEATNGEEAVAKFGTDHPDLVLLDVNMPKVDGIETLRQIKAIDPDAVVIMLTSLANRHTVEVALEIGAANYIRKDTPKEEIVRALQETISACFEPEEPTP